jgi:hypothetical protein
MKRQVIIIAIILAILITVIAVGNIDQFSPTPTPPQATPNTHPPETSIRWLSEPEVVNLVMNYIGTNHTETAALMSDLNWTGGNVSPKNLVNYAWFQYSSGNWVVRMGIPIFYMQIFEITVHYTDTNVSVLWEGTLLNGKNLDTNVTYNGNITQTLYHYGPAPSPSPKPAPTPITNNTGNRLSEPEVVSKVMSYIKTNHTETAALMSNLNWTGGNVTPENQVNYEWFQYSSGSWTVRMGMPIFYMQVYQVTAHYNDTDISVLWTGTFKNGKDLDTGHIYNATVTEASYIYKKLP